MKLNKDRFLKEVEESTLIDDNGDELIFVEDLVSILRNLVCKAESCDNEARYSSGYCGICDIQHNDGKGERL